MMILCQTGPSAITSDIVCQLAPTHSVASGYYNSLHELPVGNKLG